MPWTEFSPKALRSIDESTARLNIWHGAVRSSKTVSSMVRWIQYIDAAPPGDLLMIGKTERTLGRNILNPMQEILGQQRMHWNRGAGEVFIAGRRIYIVGANDERAEQKIRGLTIAGAYADEITLYPESFFVMLLSRLSVPGAKLFGTTNSDSSYHWLKENYLDREDLNLRQWHFELEDNLSLDPQFVDDLKREYVGLWYKRYILGLWVAAEGAIYDMFDIDKHEVDNLPVTEDGRPAIKRSWVLIDYGTTNPTVFLWLVQCADNCLYVADEWRWDSAERGRQKSDPEYSKDLRDFLQRIGHRPQWIFIDPSAASFIVQCSNDRIPNIAGADNSVLDGIRYTSSLLSANRLKFIKGKCEGTIKEMLGYVWDANAQKHGEDKPVKAHDHGPDCIRYGVNSSRLYWEPWLRKAA